MTRLLSAPEAAFIAAACALGAIGATVGAVVTLALAEDCCVDLPGDDDYLPSPWFGEGWAG